VSALQLNPTFLHSSVFSPRRAKKKLPKEIKKKVEEWKFSSGALVLCLVAYSDGQNVQTFKSVHSSI
jgi:hypothetical protein